MSVQGVIDNGVDPSSITKFFTDIFIVKIPQFLIRLVGYLYLVALGMMVAAGLLLGVIGLAALVTVLTTNVLGLVTAGALLFALILGPVPGWIRSMAREIFKEFTPRSPAT